MNNSRTFLGVTQDAALFSAREFFRPLVVIYRAVAEALAGQQRLRQISTRRTRSGKRRTTTFPPPTG